MKNIKTYQDLLLVPQNEEARMKFVADVIDEHKATKAYDIAYKAEKYFKHQNITINQYQKLLYTVSGKAIPDIWSANFKMASNFYFLFIVQEVQHLLGNGVSFQDKKTKDRLGKGEKSFDNQVQEVATNALNGGIAFGYFDYDHIESFSFLEFAPLYDEISGRLKSGVRFWRIAPDKPLRAVLYELDGHTDYLWLTDEKSSVNLSDDWIRISSLMYYRKKQPYILKVEKSKAGGEQITDGGNYPDLPIVPMWGNKEHQSEFVGKQEQIDCFDLIRSGYANDVDDASLIYWTLNNAGGMDDIDLAKFVERLKTVKAAKVDGEAQAESHTVDVPYASREALLERLRAELYEDAMALDTKALASGGSVVTAVIKAAYEPLTEKVDRFEYCVTQFIDKILELAGIDDTPTYTRSMMINQTEMIQNWVMAAPYVTEEEVTRGVLEAFGKGDIANDVIAQMQADNLPTIDEEETE